MSKSKTILEMFEFTESEVMSLSILNDGLLKFIKTQLATESMRARNLVPPATPDGYIQFVQQKAFIDGAISAWEFLLNNHEETVSKMAI